MEKYTENIPKPYIKKTDGLLLELLEDYPPYADRATAIKKRRDLLEVHTMKIRIVPHNDKFFLYRVVVSSRNRLVNK